MFISIGYFLLSLSRWLRFYRRHNMYLQAIRQVYRSGSVFVQRACNVRSRTLAPLLRSPLVESRGDFTEETVLSDECMLISQVKPMQTLQLADWTSYYRPQGLYKPSPTGENVMVLVEAVRPADIDTFLEHELAVAPAQKVHVLAHGAAVAWKSGPPFGIVLHCSLDEFITLATAFVDGSLTVDEDLEVSTLLTVKTEGQSSSLVQGESDSTQQVTKAQTPTARSPTPRYISPTPRTEQELPQDTWSNESLASSPSVGRVTLLEMSDTDFIEGDVEEVVEGSYPDGGSGEGLSDMEIEVSASKPPNVLVYCGKVDTVRKFEFVKAVLEQCLDPDCYVIYPLKHEELNSPWIKDTALLVMATKRRYSEANKAFLTFFQSGGKILGLGSGFDSTLVEQIEQRRDNWVSDLSYKSWQNVELVAGRYSYDVSKPAIADVTVSQLGTDKSKNVNIVKVSNSVAGMAILSQILFDKDASYLGVTPELFVRLKKSNATRFDILRDLLTSMGLECNPQTPPALTPAVLITKNEEVKGKFLGSVESRLTDGILKSGTQSLTFTTDPGTPAEENQLPVLTEDSRGVGQNFDTQTYMGNLHTRVLGNTVLFVDVVPTTMPLLDGLMFSAPKDVGLIAVARKQTRGKGRGGNSWLSPVGCAMFTLHVRVPQDTHLGGAISYLQHIMSLGVVQAVCSLPGYEDIQLRLKWPNDIYYSNQMKLGGVIVKTSTMDRTLHAIIGCGVNLDNSNPTICINDIIQLHNRQHGTNLPSLTTEQLIARAVSSIEQLIERFQAEGPDGFRKQYYEKWLHSNQEVTLQSQENMKVTIVGLDEYGYLLVETKSKEKITVMPDGNSFDMMENLIMLKTRT